MVCLSVVLSLATRAAADNAADIELAKAHFRTGQIYYERGRYPDAAHEFEEAFRLSGHGDLLYNMGKAYDGGGDPARALEAYRRFIVAVPNSPDRAAVRQRIAELEQKIARLEIVSNVDDATITVDSIRRGRTPMAAPIEVNPGPHELVASKEGYRTFRASFDARSGERLEMRPVLESLTVVKIVEVPSRAPPRPLYRRWWLWTVVGVVAVGAAAGIAVAATQEAPLRGTVYQVPRVEGP
jgi:tetratricopeptide (TPR) repeat protein